MKGTILIVDDDTAHLSMLQTVLQSLGHAIDKAFDGEDAIRGVKKTPYDLVLMDVRMANVDGMEALTAIKAFNPAIPIIIMTAYSSVDTAVEAMKLGAYDYLTKPLNFDDLKLTIERAIRHLHLTRENADLKKKISADTGFSRIIGTSPAMKTVMETAAIAAPTDATILLTGESGTGKELFAKAIHDHSNRKTNKLVSINCAALNETLLESELFGHEKGAFTGADKKRDGLFLHAHKGTIFLDEIADIPLSIQVKLLRAIQEREIQRVGSDRPIRIDVRIIVATNRHLEQAVKHGQFREDLFYRLNVINIKVPALKERTADIPLLAQHFLTRYAQKNRKRFKGFTPVAMDAMLKHPWPGNVRELENAVERAVILSMGQYISEKDLPADVVKNYRPDDVSPDSLPELGGKSLEEVEAMALIQTLKQTGGNKSAAAKLLHITRTTLNSKIKKYQIDLAQILSAGPE
ncbi:MAG TPA: sigma-54 dependent transcriptional regulator [Desulfotignum sp.]|nr:sigma-54 dependent transcriptional regulator [Desulfotignum sp.]